MALQSKEESLKDFSSWGYKFFHLRFLSDNLGEKLVNIFV
jgi:hypothetical protein